MLDKKNITGIILVGGQSRRMGRDKGLINLHGKSFLERIINAVQPYSSKVLLVGDQSIYEKFGVERIEDEIKNEGPIAGVYSGLLASKTKYSLVLSCDVPLINSEIIQFLIEEHDPNFDLIQLSCDERSMPLIGLYKKSCHSHLQRILNSGEKRLTEAVKGLKVKTIPLMDHQKKYVLNVNTEEDLKKIKYDLEY